VKAATFNYTALFYIILIDRCYLIKWEKGETAYETRILPSLTVTEKKHTFNSNMASRECF